MLIKFSFLTKSDVLHPNRANVSKEDLRVKLADTYKVNKDQVSVFGFRTQYGGGKSTGFALIYDSHEALKKFEPHYRLVRYGIASKIEKPSRQQRTSNPPIEPASLFLSLIAIGEPTGLIIVLLNTGKQRKNRAKTVRGTAKTKGGAKDKAKKK